MARYLNSVVFKLQVGMVVTTIILLFLLKIYRTEEKLGSKNFDEFGESVKICQSFFANLQSYHVNMLACCNESVLIRLASG